MIAQGRQWNEREHAKDRLEEHFKGRSERLMTHEEKRKKWKVTLRLSGLLLSITENTSSDGVK